MQQLNVRVSDELAELLRVAAFQTRKTKTAIIVEATEKAVRKIVEKGEKRNAED